MFPVITCLADLEPHIQNRSEIRINTLDNGYHVVCYMISDGETFNGPSAAFLRECRGITFYPDGKIASRPLHKFFNVNERPDTQLDKLNLSLQNVVRAMDKRDGSMLHPVFMQDGTIAMKSKKTFTSDVAIKATRFVHAPENADLLSACIKLLTVGFTPIFEFTSPDNRIVLQYEKTEMKLLHVRNTVNGAYMSQHALSRLAEQYNIEAVDEYAFTDIQSLISNIDSTEGIEGYIFQFANGDMVKLKTPWYMNLHHTVTFTRERDVAQMVLNETIDDYKAYLVDVGAQDTMDKVLAIESKVCKAVLQLEKEVDSFLSVGPALTATRKDFAMFHKSNPLFKLIMDRYSNKTVDYKYFYEANHLKDDFSLDQI